MGINRSGSGSGGQETLYLPLLAKTWHMEVVSATFRPSTREGWQDQISFCLQVAGDDRERLVATAPKPGAGEQQGDRAWYSVGATLNGHRRDGYRPTKFAEFVSVLFGSEQQAEVAAWIKDGGGWDGMDSDDTAEIESGLEWFVGLQCLATVMHPTPNPDGRIFPRVKGAVPIGDREPDPDYERFGRRKFDLLNGSDSRTPAEQGVADGAAVSADYTAHGEPIDTATGEIDAADTAAADEEEAELERLLAVAKAKKAAAKGGSDLADPSSLAAAYDRQFGSAARA